MKYRVLIVEDEPGIADGVQYALETEGFEAVWKSSGGEGLALLGAEHFDLVILDVGLPDMSGFDVLRRLRAKRSTPVLFLTARAEESDRVLGLELGGDDYLAKPFSPRELTARARAILRRTGSGPAAAPFELDEHKKQIRYLGEALVLSRYEYGILELMIKRPGWIFSREKIMELVWEDPMESTDRTVDTHIKTIRAKLQRIRAEDDPILTHRGMGYSLREDL